MGLLSGPMFKPKLLARVFQYSRMYDSSIAKSFMVQVKIACIAVMWFSVVLAVNCDKFGPCTFSVKKTCF